MSIRSSCGAATDFSSFARPAPASAGTVVQTTLNGGRFSVPLAFTEDQVGSYAIDAFVFMDGEGLPISTSTVTPFFVE